MEFLLVHLNELHDEVGPVETGILQSELTNIIFVKVALALYLSGTHFQSMNRTAVETHSLIGMLGFQIGNNILFDHHVFPTLFLDGLFQVLVDMKIALEKDSLDDVIPLE